MHKQTDHTVGQGAHLKNIDLDLDKDRLMNRA